MNINRPHYLHKWYGRDLRFAEPRELEGMLKALPTSTSWTAQHLLSRARAEAQRRGLTC